MQSIVRNYGQEKGMEAWETIADTLDPALKGEIFVAMLIGDFSGRITIGNLADGSNAVACIKAIRSVDNRRLGLKEAKDMYDALRYQNSSIQIEVHGKNRTTAVQELRSVGFVI
jgi:hypothetical protein